MAGNYKRDTDLIGTSLATGQLAGTSEAVVYTVQDATGVKIASANVHNASGSTLASVAVFKTPKIGGTVGTKTRIAYVTALAAGDSTTVFELVGQFLEAGCVISMQASAGSAANFDLTGAISQ